MYLVGTDFHSNEPFLFCLPILLLFDDMIIARLKYFVRTDFHRNEPNEPFLFLCTNDSPGRFSQAGSACCITSQNNTKYHHNWSWTKNSSWAGLDLVGKKNSAVLFYQLLRSTTNHKEWRHKWWSSKDWHIWSWLLLRVCLRAIKS